jgi:glycosyltransferase involved in cell wall biosynthesis
MSAAGGKAVSLIVATWNRGPRIARTLDSVRAQTRPPEEVVVVDDCSSDGTADWVCDNYREVRVVRTERNLGTSGARNCGAAAATGELLVFLDHDDELLPHAIETLTSNLREFPRARASYADHIYLNHTTGVRYENHHSARREFGRLGAVATEERRGPQRLFGRSMYYALLRGNLLQQPWCVDRRTFLDVGGFAEDVRWCEDWDLYLRLADRVPVVLGDEVISIHHIEGSNLHLTPNQDVMYVRVLERQLAVQRWSDWRARAITRRRLAQFAKSAGDRARPAGVTQAWRHYARSLMLWPFDHVVFARTLLWLPPLLMARPSRAEAR